MWYIPKIDNYLIILTDDVILMINFSKCFKSTREKLHSKLNENQILENMLNR